MPMIEEFTHNGISILRQPAPAPYGPLGSVVLGLVGTAPDADPAIPRSKAYRIANPAQAAKLDMTGNERGTLFRAVNEILKMVAVPIWVVIEEEDTTTVPAPKDYTMTVSSAKVDELGLRVVVSDSTLVEAVVGRILRRVQLAAAQELDLAGVGIGVVAQALALALAGHIEEGAVERIAGQREEREQAETGRHQLARLQRARAPGQFAWRRAGTHRVTGGPEGIDGQSGETATRRAQAIARAGTTISDGSVDDAGAGCGHRGRPPAGSRRVPQPSPLRGIANR